MAADNAIIIGLIAANYSPDNRKKIIAFGVAAAFIFRVVFALSATFLLTIPWMKLVGGILLIWVINNLRQDLFETKTKHAFFFVPQKKAIATLGVRLGAS